MIIDILAGALLLYSAWAGSRTGAMAALYRVGMVAVAIVLAKLLAKPTANYLMRGIEWSAPFSYGLCFLIYFLFFLVVLTFALAAVVRSAEVHSGDGGSFDMAVGGLLGMVRGAAILYAVLASAVLLSHRLGAKKPMFAFSYDKAWVGRQVMTRNIADPEKFPNAYFLRVMVGAEPNQGFNPNALPLALALPQAKFLQTDEAAVAAIRQSDWRSLRNHRPLLELMCSAEFLAVADDYITPRHKVEAENPEERFQELKAK